MREKVNILKNMQHKLNKVFFLRFLFCKLVMSVYMFRSIADTHKQLSKYKNFKQFLCKKLKKATEIVNHVQLFVKHRLSNCHSMSISIWHLLFMYLLEFLCPFPETLYCYLFTVSLLLCSWVNTQKNLVEKRGVWEVFTLIISSIQIIYINNQSLYILHFKSML